MQPSPPSLATLKNGANPRGDGARVDGPGSEFWHIGRTLTSGASVSSSVTEIVKQPTLLTPQG